MHPAGGVEPLFRQRPLKRVLVSGTRFLAPMLARTGPMPVRDDWAARARVPRDDPRKSLVGLALVAVAGAYNC